MSIHDCYIKEVWKEDENGELYFDSFYIYDPAYVRPYSIRELAVGKIREPNEHT